MMDEYMYTNKWEWDDISELDSKSYKCYNCGEKVMSNLGYVCYVDKYKQNVTGEIYICHNCKCPTYFKFGEQIPGSKYGDDIKYLTEEIESIYEEARNCFSVNAFTSVVLCCRKLLMNISCELGAPEGLRFVKYIDYLEDNNHIPSRAKPWIDKIRQLGNDGTHKIENRTKEEAELAIQFTGILLKIIYEMPGRLDDI